MSDDAPCSETFLLPGELHVGCGDERVHTLLGSCVAVTLWSGRHHVGGICHYVLPCSVEPDEKRAHGHYGDMALHWLLEQMHQRGIGYGELEAKIIGGGAVLEIQRTVDGIGVQNIALARHYLKTAGVAVVAEDVGRRGYRRLVFDISDGSVWVLHKDSEVLPRVSGG